MPNSNDQKETETPTTTLNRLPDSDGPTVQELERDAQEAASAYRDIEIEPAKPPVRIKFDPAVEYDGQSYDELIFDFDRMIGKDFQRCEREFTRLYKPDRDETPLPELKPLYHAIILAHAGYRPNERPGSGVPLGLIQKLPRRYYTPLRLEALKACGSSPEEEKV
jgi:hypothetical protein